MESLLFVIHGNNGTNPVQEHNTKALLLLLVVWVWGELNSWNLIFPICKMGMKLDLPLGCVLLLNTNLFEMEICS